MKIGYFRNDVKEAGNYSWTNTPSNPKPTALLHKGSSQWKWGSYNNFGLCKAKYLTEKNVLTDGKWSFRVKDWDGVTRPDSTELAFEFLSTGKIKIPTWAYEAPKCSICFPETLTFHVETCTECGHERKVINDTAALVRGTEGAAALQKA